MPEHASRFAAALYDQFEDEHRVADWGGDELFTRMPRPRAVDDAPAPRFRPYLAAVEPGARRATGAPRRPASDVRATRARGAESAGAARLRAALARVEPQSPSCDAPTARERRVADGAPSRRCSSAPSGSACRSSSRRPSPCTAGTSRAR